MKIAIRKKKKDFQWPRLGKDVELIIRKTKNKFSIFFIFTYEENNI